MDQNPTIVGEIASNLMERHNINRMHALAVLEFDEVRRRLARHCETELAASEALELVPLFDRAKVEALQEITAEGHDLIARDSPPSLAAAKDLFQALDRAAKQGSLSGQDLFLTGEALAAMRSVRQHMRSKGATYPKLAQEVESLPDLPRLETAIFDSVESNGDVKDSASPELQGIRQRKKSATSRILERIQSYTTGSKRDLLSDPIYTVRDGRYVVPLKAENRGKLRGIVHDTSATGATLFVEPEDVLQLGNALRELEAKERDEIQRILISVSGKVGAVAGQIAEGLRAAARIDLTLAKARLAFEQRACKPEPMEGVGLKVQHGRHPLLPADRVVPLDLSIGGDLKGLLITGPNTGGKTVALKAIGLFVAMLQSGLFVPAAHVRYGVFSQIWADIGDEQSLEQSLSTFSGHITNIAAALKSTLPGALVLLDELGAGTDPAEGAALARSVLLELAESGAFILASTHYGELKAFAYSQPGFANAAMEFDSKTLRPTYRLLMGAPGASQALRIAERYGIPKRVVERAKEGLSEQHLDLAAMMEELERSQRLARAAQSEADRRSLELARREALADQKIAAADESRRNAQEQARVAIEQGLRELRLQAAELFEELRKTPADRANAREQVAALQSLGDELAEPFKRKVPKPKDLPTLQFKKGETVRVEGYSGPGVVLEEPRDGKLTVQFGILRMVVDLADVRPSHDAQPARSRRGESLQLRKAQTASTEIQLIGLRADEARDRLDRFLDDAALGGIDTARIVHGKGTGALRRIAIEALRAHREVKSFRDGEPAEGGAGVTIATFR